MNLQKNVTKEQVIQALTDIARAHKEMGELLVTYLAKHRNGWQELIAAGVSQFTLYFFEALGNGKTLPELYPVAATPAGSRLLRCPLHEQARAVKDGIEVVQNILEGKPIIVRRQIQEITESLAARTFSKDGKRLLTTDEKIHELNIELQKKSARAKRYFIQDGKVTFTGKCTFNIPDLIAELTKFQAQPVIDIAS
jgi:hypothetical protein